MADDFKAVAESGDLAGGRNVGIDSEKGSILGCQKRNHNSLFCIMRLLYLKQGSPRKLDLYYTQYHSV